MKNLIATLLVLLSANLAQAEDIMAHSHVLNFDTPERVVVTPVACEVFTPSGGYFGDMVEITANPSEFDLWLDFWFAPSSEPGVYRIACFFGAQYADTATLVRTVDTFVR